MRHPRKRSRYLAIGTISEGTLRPGDLIPAYLDALRPVRMSKADRQTVREISARYQSAERSDAQDGNATDYYREDAALDMQTLADLADQYAPPYTQCGSTDGDGALIGVWPAVPDDGDDDVFRSDDGPHAYTPGKNLPCDQCSASNRHDCARAGEYGYWLEVNDHGNCTLYARVGRTWGRYREIWSVV